MKFNKKLGWALLILSIWIFSPIPGPDDLVGLQLYSLYSGVDVGFENLSEIYLDYFIFTTVIALILFAISLHFLGWSMKRVWKKLDIGKYKISLAIGVGALILITYLNMLHLIYYLLGALALIYFFMIRKDKSEALSVFISPLVLMWFGLTDLLGFVFQRVPIPEILNLNRPVVEWISLTLGFSSITPFSLILSIICGFLVIFLLTRVLKEKF